MPPCVRTGCPEFLLYLYSYLCICVFLHLCINVFVYLCICMPGGSHCRPVCSAGYMDWCSPACANRMHWISLYFYLVSCLGIWKMSRICLSWVFKCRLRFSALWNGLEIFTSACLHLNFDWCFRCIECPQFLHPTCYQRTTITSHSPNSQPLKLHWLPQAALMSPFVSHFCTFFQPWFTIMQLQLMVHKRKESPPPWNLVLLEVA